MKKLVVAQWREDTSWTDDVDKKWDVTIVTKDQQLPNRGREATSYLWQIIVDYDDIENDDVYAFLQGDPFPHSHNLFDTLALTDKIDGFTPFGGGSPVVVTYPATGERVIFKEPFISDGSGRPHHDGLPISYWYEKWTGIDFPDAGVPFYPGAQFMVNGATILQKPLEFYKQIYEDTMEENDALPYVLERLWPSLFSFMV